MPLTARLVRVSQDEWSCAAITNVFSIPFYTRIVQGLDHLVWSEAVQSFYRQREVNLKGIPYYDNLFDKHVRSQIAHSLSLFFHNELDSDFDIAAHMMITGDYIGVHTDANEHGETHRMTITLNDDWSVSDGGVLLTLNDGALSSVRDAWLPTANNGFVFEISESSYHAVSPIVGHRPRYSLILTFKSARAAHTSQPSWMPFVLQEDVESASSTAGHMGISSETFRKSYKFIEFNSVDEFSCYVGSQLENAPSQWSYRKGTSINVDQNGHQPKGTDKKRIDAVKKLRRIPPILIVRRKSGRFFLVDGSHRLSHANDAGTSLGVAVFDEA